MRATAWAGALLALLSAAAAQAPLPAACATPASPEIFTDPTGSFAVGSQPDDPDSVPLPPGTQCFFYVDGQDPDAVVSLTLDFVAMGPPGCSPADAAVRVYQGYSLDDLLSETCYWEPARRLLEAPPLPRAGGRSLRRHASSSPAAVYAAPASSQSRTPTPSHSRTPSRTPSRAPAAVSASASSTGMPTPPAAGLTITGNGSLLVVLTVETGDLDDAWGFSASYAITGKPASSSSPSAPSPPAATTPTATLAPGGGSPSTTPSKAASGVTTASGTPSPTAADPGLPSLSSTRTPTSGGGGGGGSASPSPSASASATASASSTPADDPWVVSPSGSGSASPSPAAASSGSSSSRTPSRSRSSSHTPTKGAAKSPSTSAAPTTPAGPSPGAPSSSGGPGPTLPPATSAGALLAASVTLHGAPNKWNALVTRLTVPVFLGTLRTDVAEALGVSTYRLDGWQYIGTVTQPAVAFQILPPLVPGGGAPQSSPARLLAVASATAAADPSVGDLTSALYSQLQTPTSALYNGTVSSGFQASYWSVAYAQPAAVALSPPVIGYSVPYSHVAPRGRLLQQVTITNTGGSSLTIASLSIAIVDDGGYPNAGSILTLTNVPPLPLTVPPSGTTTFGVSADTSGIPDGSTRSLFALVSLQHNAPAGPYAVGVSVDITGAPTPGGGGGGANGNIPAEPPVLESQGFKVGAGAGFGLCAALLVIGCVVYWRCCKCCHRSGAKPGAATSSAGAGSSSSSSSKKGSSSSGKADDKEGSSGSGTGTVARGGRLDSSSDDSGSEKDGKRRSRSGRSHHHHRKRSGSGGGGGDRKISYSLTSSDDDSGSGGEGDKRRSGRHSSKRGTGNSSSSAAAAAGSVELTRLSAGTSLSLPVAGAGGTLAPPAPAAYSSGSSATGTTMIVGGGGSPSTIGITSAPPLAAAASSSSAAPLSFAGLTIGGVSASSALAPHMPSSSPQSGAGTPGSGFGRSLPSSTASSGGGGKVVLRPKPVLKPSEFDARWASLETVEIWGATLQAPPPGAAASDIGGGTALGDAVEKALAVAHIPCMASGAVSTGVSKHFFYAQDDATGKLCMVEVTVTAPSSRLSAVIKAADAGVGAGFVEAFKAALAPMMVAL